MTDVYLDLHTADGGVATTITLEHGDEDPQLFPLGRRPPRDVERKLVVEMAKKLHELELITVTVRSTPEYGDDEIRCAVILDPCIARPEPSGNR